MRQKPLSTPPGWEAMPRLPARASSAREAGFTLIEFIVGVVIALVVAAATGSFMVTSLRSANAASSRATAVRQAELFLAHLTREVRQAQRIESVSAATNKSENKTPVNVTYGESGTTSVSFYLPNAGSSAAGTEVTWSCSKTTKKCTRTAKGSSPVTQLTGVGEATFSPYSAKGSLLPSGAGAAIAANPQYPSSIELALSVEDISQLDTEHTHLVPGVSNQTTIVVQDGVSLRNYSS
jgi:prepilin-type N-terminal cleavage/methylation domain-containing protein